MFVKKSIAGRTKLKHTHTHTYVQTNKVDEKHLKMNYSTVHTNGRGLSNRFDWTGKTINTGKVKQTTVDGSDIYINSDGVENSRESKTRHYFAIRSHSIRYLCMLHMQINPHIKSTTNENNQMFGNVEYIVNNSVLFSAAAHGIVSSSNAMRCDAMQSDI